MNMQAEIGHEELICGCHFCQMREKVLSLQKKHAAICELINAFCCKRQQSWAVFVEKGRTCCTQAARKEYIM